MTSHTETLSRWISSITLEQIPERIRCRAKYLILDGLACGLVGAHLPWSEKAAHTMFAIETGGGESMVIGWGGQTLSTLSAALLNSTFIQGFEIDDWHSGAPLHSNSILLPALLAAAQHEKLCRSSKVVSGSELLLATIVGYEIGPRVGLALYGAHVLSMGWHSGAVFGPAASAAAVSRLFGLEKLQVEDALGIACTQACGLMSAQYGSEVKRMQHGFAARNGLLAAFLARNGYVGIKGVFEQEFGGFLQQFSAGNGKLPPYKLEELTKGLGKKWQTDEIRVKPYAAMAGTHSTIDCVRALQERYADYMNHKLGDITAIKITLGEAAYHHGGWKPTRPLTSTGAQMNNAFVAATQMVHCQVLVEQFGKANLENDEIWRLINVTQTELNKDPACALGEQTITIEFADGTVIVHTVQCARGVDPELSNDEILQKWRELTEHVMDQTSTKRIEEIVMSLETIDDIEALCKLLSSQTICSIE